MKNVNLSDTATTIPVTRRRPRGRCGDYTIHMHKCPVCPVTGLVRYRDRSQARDAVSAIRWQRGRTVGRARSDLLSEAHIHRCPEPECAGFHLAFLKVPVGTLDPVEPVAAFMASLSFRPCRIHLIDLENLARGGGATVDQIADLWRVYRRQAPGIAPGDHVVIGAARNVARRYRAAIRDEQVKWVVGADAPDGADQALLSAIDLRRVAKKYDELVLGTGDHAFVPLARQARALGMTVQVVTTEDPHFSPLSRELSAVATTRTTIRLASREQQRQIVAAIHRIHAASLAA